MKNHQKKLYRRNFLEHSAKITAAGIFMSRLPAASKKLINIENEKILRKFLKQTAYGQKIYIGMGAGSISSWMKNLKNNI